MASLVDSNLAIKIYVWHLKLLDSHVALYLIVSIHLRHVGPLFCRVV